jgi:ankyrin repeat protein
MGTTALFEAVSKGNLAMVQCLVQELGASIKQATHDTKAPLFVAAFRGSLAIVQCIAIEGGSDVNQADEMGYTALHYAATSAAMLVWCGVLLRNTPQTSKT